MVQRHRVLSIGAHPDDADTSSGGLLLKLRDAGYEVRMLSLTDGGAGTYHRDIPRSELVLQRRSEAAASGRLLGGRYDVLDEPDGRFIPTLERREALIRYIRHFAPDVIITNRSCDYHIDHRNTALLVEETAYLLTVPRVCEDMPHMTHMPAIFYWHDGFERPVPFQVDVIVPLSSARVEQLVALACCHESQYFDWMYMPDHPEKIAWPREKQIADLSARYHAFTRRNREAAAGMIARKYSKEDAARIGHVEFFERSGYGGEPSKEFLAVAEAAE